MVIIANMKARLPVNSFDRDTTTRSGHQKPQGGSSQNLSLKHGTAGTRRTHLSHSRRMQSQKQHQVSCDKLPDAHRHCSDSLCADKSSAMHGIDLERNIGHGVSNAEPMVHGDGRRPGHIMCAPRAFQNFCWVAQGSPERWRTRRSSAHVFGRDGQQYRARLRMNLFWKYTLGAVTSQGTLF